MLLITGANGQLGQTLSALLPDAIAVDFDKLDITDENAVNYFCQTNKIDTIVNCAAYTAVDKAEDDRDLCYAVNVKGVENLAKTGATIIHISTDYVFDGKSCKPYTELDEATGTGVYAQTKRASEIALFELAKTAVVLRTSWLYSAVGNNFVKTMRRLGSDRSEISVVFDQIGTPTCADDLAAAIVAILPQIKAGSKEIYHYSNEGVASWYDFAVQIMRLSGLKCKVRPLHSSEYPTKATRPFYSVLDKTKIKQTFGIKIPHWQESLEKCLKKF